MKKRKIYVFIETILIYFSFLCLPLYAYSEMQELKSQTELKISEDVTQSEDEEVIEIEEIAEVEEVTGREEVTEVEEVIDSNEKISWEKCIPVEAKQVKENIMGYTLMRTTEEIYYVRDSDYLLEKDIIGKGVFVSEHVNEMEIFIGQLLVDVINERGVILEEEKQYFSDWAIEQIHKTNWKELDENWKPDPYLYDRSYTINYLFGDAGYDFTYSFYPNRKEIEEADQIVTVKILIDNNGIIRGVNVEINDTRKGSAGIVEITNRKELFDDELQEEVIEEGILYPDKVVYEQSGIGLLSSEDAAVSGKEIGNIIIDMLESKGKNTAAYSMQFEDENAFRSFQELSWNQLDEGWKANPYYDCFYINDGTYTDDCTFLYYIYPNYDEMETETAGAITFRCSVSGSSGKFIYTDLRIYAMTQKEYQAAREWLGKKSIFRKDGEIRGSTNKNVKLSIPENSLTPDFISNVTINKQVDVQEEKSSGKEDRVFIDRSIDVGSLGETMIENMNIGIVEWLEPATEIYEVMENGWAVRQEYDAYYMAHNEKAGTHLYRYYFYWNKPEEEKEKVLVADIWISQSGVTDTRLYWYMGRSHNKLEEDSESVVKGASLEVSDIDTFLAFDWSADSVLLYDHAIEPQDSAQGWQFFLADIDFDEKLEMLIAFTANHCGDNSLYVYRQKDGKVVSYIDTVATPKEYMRERINYHDISPYMEIDLLDAYVNENKEYRYLSLDSSSFGEDIYTVILYETVLGETMTPKEIARISMIGEGKERKYFFLGEDVYEAGRLRDMIADYMYGYEKVDLDYIDLKITFPRDIVELSEEEQAQELEELYESIRKIVTSNNVE